LKSSAVSATLLKAKSLYEAGRLHWSLGEFKNAIVKVQQAAELYEEVQEFETYFRCQALILRMYAEMAQPKHIQELRAKIEKVLKKEGLSHPPVILTVYAFLAQQQKDLSGALDYLQKALAAALAKENKEDTCHAIYGLVVVYAHLNRLDDALNEIYNLKVFFQVLDLPEVELSTAIMNGYILVFGNKYEEALNIFWSAMEKLRSRQNVYSYVNLLYALGYTYRKMGDAGLARTYLMLAKQIVDPDSFVMMSKNIEDELSALSTKEAEYDLIFDKANNAVVERKKGRIDFKNQFILMDLLKLFLKNPGEVFSKESLAKTVWKQDYDPRYHDNKIYVTIKRLRKLIEPDYDKPKYIHRAKNGYYLNKSTRISVQ
jgi:tetratricopeptide (TPR) repeat protein